MRGKVDGGCKSGNQGRIDGGQLSRTEDEGPSRLISGKAF